MHYSFEVALYWQAICPDLFMLHKETRFGKNFNEEDMQINNWLSSSQLVSYEYPLVVCVRRGDFVLIGDSIASTTARPLQDFISQAWRKTSPISGLPHFRMQISGEIIMCSKFPTITQLFSTPMWEEIPACTASMFAFWGECSSDSSTQSM